MAGVPPFLKKGLSGVREINWGKSFNWDIKIDGCPAPFSEWFPATEIDRGVATAMSHDIMVGTTGYRIPYGKQQQDLRLTFGDDDQGTLEAWLADWYGKSGLFRGGLANQYVATLTEACKAIQFAHLDNTKSLVHSHTLWVYPEGQFSTVYDSQSAMKIHVCAFTIVASYKG